MNYQDFRDSFLDFFVGKEKLTIEIIDNEKIIFIMEELNYKFNYNIKILYDFLIRKNKEKKNFSSFFNFDINSLTELTKLNKNELLQIFNRNKIKMELLDRDNLNILSVARDCEIDIEVEKKFDLSICYNHHYTKKDNLIRFSFDGHISQILNILELFRTSNIDADYIEWYHNADALNYSSYDEYIKGSIEKNKEYIGKWYLTYSIVIGPECYNHNYINNLVNIYKGDIFFSNQDIYSLANLNIECSQDCLVDGVGLFLLFFLINTNTNIYILNYSDDLLTYYTTRHFEIFKNTILINILIFIKYVTVVKPKI